MFTGIVEETGVVQAIRPGPRSIRLELRARRCGKGLKTGDSLALNGCCLTVVGSRTVRGGRTLLFDLLRETWDKTNLKALRPGALVNLERPLRADGRVDGHFVTGHIDGVGIIRRWEQVGNDWSLEVVVPRKLMPYLVYKGSIALDGISLTVASVKANRFSVWIIPHTYAVTALRDRKIGDAVNVETDILAKYLERQREGRRRRKL